MSNSPRIEDSALQLYLNSISNSKPLSSAHEKELCISIKRGNEQSLHKLVTANLRFVVSVAHNYQNQGLPMTDLINEGNIGLIRAAKRFDESKEFRFISYAVWWIRQAILAALANQSRITHIPINVANMYYHARKYEAKFEQQHYRKPTDEEMAKELGITLDQLNKFVNVDTCSSLDSKIPGDDNLKLNDLIGKEHEALEGDPERRSDSTTIEEVLRTLEEREAEIIRLYFGIGYDTNFTLGQIAKKYKLTRERIRQIKLKAITKLRHNTRSKVLKSCYA